MAKAEISVQVNLVSFAYGIPGVPDRQKYLRALHAELASVVDYAEDYLVRVLCITGSSPLQYPVDALTNIINTLKQSIAFQKNAEITVNALPGSVTYADLRALAEQGVNRIRFDMRTFVQSELDTLGRTYSPSAIEVFMRMVQLKMIFFNYEVVLYYGLPGQTLESLLYSVEQAIRFMGTSITLLPYSGEDKPKYFSFYQEAVRAIKFHGFQEFTPEHFSRPGYAGLWNRQTYSNQPRLGFGVDALSSIDGMISQNTADVQAYMAADGEPAEIMVKLEPVSQNRIEANSLLESLYTLEERGLSTLNSGHRRIIDSLCERGLLRVNDGAGVALTEAGKADWQTVAGEIMA